MLWNNAFGSMKKDYFFILNSLVYHKFESGSSKTVGIFQANTQKIKIAYQPPRNGVNHDSSWEV